MEMVRRVVLVVGVGAALWLAIVPVPARVVLSAQDFAADQARRPAWSGDRKLPLDDFVRERTKDRMTRVTGDAWARVAEAATALERGTAIPPDAPGPVGTRHGGSGFYVAPNAPFLGDVGSRLGERTPLLYLRLDDDAATPWLTALWLAGSEGGDVEPSSIFHPHRYLWPWVLLATLALYVFLPRPRREANTLRSHPRAAVVMPDVLGTLLFGAFFGLSLFLASDMSSTGHPLAADWIVPTLILWAFSLSGIAILWIAAHYAALRFRLLPDRVERVSLTGTSSCPYASIVSAVPGTREPPKALGCLGLLVGLVNWRALGPTLLAAGRSTDVLDVQCADGTSWRISLSALEDPERLVEALQAKGPGTPSD